MREKGEERDDRPYSDYHRSWIRKRGWVARGYGGSSSSSPLEGGRLPTVRPKMFTEEELFEILRQSAITEFYSVTTWENEQEDSLLSSQWSTTGS